MTNAILTINAGSSTVKCSLYAAETLERKQYNSVNTIDEAIKWAGNYRFHAIGHRIVHGGRFYHAPVILTNKVESDLKELIPLAPLHQPYNLEAVGILRQLYPNLPQIACFDTAFHSTQTPINRLYPLPRALTETGIIRYGFHGLSYAYIASVLPEAIADKKVIVLHLGNGASMCALEKRQSVATSMGFTALEGLMMGTRAGSIDPGIILYLQKQRHMPIEAVEELLYHQSGLLGVSGVSHDMRVLLESEDGHAKEAINLFCLRAAREIGSLVAALGGLDALVFTAGIGEHAAPVRQKICALSAWLGIVLDEEANRRHARCITVSASKIAAYVIPTNEELMIARSTREML
jgi:acetate kinase